MFPKKNNKLSMTNFWVMVVLGMFILLAIVNIFWGNHFINSDMSAELIFANLLKEEGNWIASENWYYSTEFRVLYTQLIMVPLFYLFDDWSVVRILTNLFSYMLMIIAYYYMCKQIKITPKYIWATSLGLLVPLSETIITHVQMGNTYIWHIILICFNFGLFLKVVNLWNRYKLEKGRSGSLIYCSVLFCLLSFILGMSGIRYLLDLFIPLAITACIMGIKGESYNRLRNVISKENIKKFCGDSNCSYFYVACIAVIMAILGYLYNVIVLANKYIFQTYGATNFIFLKNGMLVTRMENAIAEFLQLFGYIANKSFISLHGFITILAFFMVIILCYIYSKVNNIVKKNQNRNSYSHFFVITFLLVSLVLHLGVFIFTSSTMVDRYYIPIIIFMLPIIALYFEYMDKKLDQYIVATMLVSCMLIMGVKSIYSLVQNDKNEERYEIVEALVSQGYTFGYASYWNSNIMTELSDGRLEMANLWSIESLNEFKWSSKKENYEERQGSIFLLIDIEELGAWMN